MSLSYTPQYRSTLLAVFSILILPGILSSRAAPAERPNVLFIIVETWRNDRSHAAGYHRDTTPNLDRAAEEGARFPRMIAASGWTMPVVMTLMTSLHPSFHAVVNSKSSLPDGITTLASVFADAGYQTAALISTPMLSPKYGYSAGFEFYDDFTFTLGVDAAALLDPTGKQSPKSILVEQFSARMTDRATSWLSSRRDPGRPFFLFLFYFDPHYDYTPPEPYRSMFIDPDYRGTQDGTGITSLKDKLITKDEKAHIIGLYDAELRCTDEHIGRLLEDVDDMGLSSNTIIAVLGDHGDEFWEHGSVAHGHSLYDELVRVPFLIKYPPVIPSATVVSSQVASVDFMPTLLDLAGLPVPDQCAGRSLLPAIRGKRIAEVPAILESSVNGPDLKAVRTPARKVIMKDGVVTALYSLDADPGETNNLLHTDQRGQFAELEAFLKKYLDEIKASGKNTATIKPELDPDLIRQLQSLGYMK